MWSPEIRSNFTTQGDSCLKRSLAATIPSPPRFMHQRHSGPEIRPKLHRPAFVFRPLRAELKGRPYEIVTVAGGYQHRTRRRYADAIQAAVGRGPLGRAPPSAGQGPQAGRSLSKTESEVLMAIAFFQPITRGDLSEIFGREISRDLIGALRSRDFIAFGPRSPQAQKKSPARGGTSRRLRRGAAGEGKRSRPNVDFVSHRRCGGGSCARQIRCRCARCQGHQVPDRSGSIEHASKRGAGTIG